MEKFEFKGLPGPYKKIPYRHGWYIEQDGDEIVNYSVASVPSNAGTNEQAEAVADLFTAAPLLLSALIKAVKMEDCKEGAYSLLSSPYTAPEWYHEAKAAIQAAISQPENVNR